MGTREHCRRWLCLLTIVAAACASAPTGPTWVVEDLGGFGVDFYDRPGGRVVETLTVPGGPQVTPVGVRGNHWQVRTPSGHTAWLDPAEFPIPELTGPYVSRYQIHVATAFAFEDEAVEALLAIQVDTLAPHAALASGDMAREVNGVWAHYRPYTAGLQQVSIMVLSSDSNTSAPIRSRQGDILGYRRLALRLCTHRIDAATWSELGRCRSNRWLERPGGFRWPVHEDTPKQEAAE